MVPKVMSVRRHATAHDTHVNFDGPYSNINFVLFLLIASDFTNVSKYAIAEVQVWSPTLHCFIRYIRDNKLAKQALKFTH